MIVTLQEFLKTFHPNETWYQAIKARCWEPDEFEVIGEPQKTYKAAYDKMRGDITHLSCCFYGILIIPSAEFVEISEADLEAAQDESYDRAYNPARVVWG